MNLSKKNVLLISFILVSITYAFVYVNDSIQKEYFSNTVMSLLIFVYYALLGFYYIVGSKRNNKIFLVALFAALCGDLLFLNNVSFILGLALFFFFILMNMLILTKKIGEIKIDTFFISIIPFLLILIMVLSLFFSNVGLLKLLFLIYGSTLGLYASFSLYFYLKDKSNLALINLIGILFFIAATVIRGLRESDEETTTYKFLNIIFFTVALLLITNAYIISDNKQVKDKKE
jgi:drug/metabolite transporter (DMT)-like permease